MGDTDTASHTVASCPFCGGRAEIRTARDSGKRAAICQDCGAIGPRAALVSLAIARWNARPAAPH